MTVGELIEQGKAKLEERGIDNAAGDAKSLYIFVENLQDENQLRMAWNNNVPENRILEYANCINKRARRKPLQHIIGHQNFYGRNFNVNSDVLIPRFDTESLVECAISIIKEGKMSNPKTGEIVEFSEPDKQWEILDLGTGSGNIAITINRECYKNTNVTASDISLEALNVAKKNGEKFSAESVNFVLGDLFKPFEGNLGGKKFDMIISNPPYIPTEVIKELDSEVKDYEPRKALDGGFDGLDFYRKIIQNTPDNLKKEGILILEIGHDQGKALKEMLEDTKEYSKIYVSQDLNGRDRVIIAKLGQEEKQESVADKMIDKIKNFYSN